METSRLFLSLIIPVYNSSKYLERCLNSLLCQNESGFEVVMVLDPSKDDSRNIILSFVNRYPFIHLIENKNRLGVQASRIEGVKNSSGAYFSFMDADDLIAPNAIRIIKSTLDESKADALNFSFYVLNKKGHPFPYPFGTKRNRLVKTKKAISMFFNDTSVRGFVWTKVFSRTLLSGDTITLLDTKDLFEEIGYVFSLLSRAKTFYVSSSGYYFYDKGNTGSLTSIPRKDRALGHLNAFAAMRMFIEKENDKELKKVFIRKRYRFYLSLLLDIFLDYKNGARHQKKTIMKGLKMVVSKKAFHPEGTVFESLSKRAISS